MDVKWLDDELNSLQSEIGKIVQRQEDYKNQYIKENSPFKKGERVYVVMKDGTVLGEAKFMSSEYSRYTKNRMTHIFNQIKNNGEVSKLRFFTYRAYKVVSRQTGKETIL